MNPLETSKDLNKIKILTYNLFMRPPPIKTNQDDYKNQRFQNFTKIIQKFDIISLQEIFQTGTFRKQKLIQVGMKKGFFYWKDCQSPNFLWGPPVDSGLLIMSKYPIIQSSFESFNVGVLSDSASDKGFIYCKIKIQNNFVHLFNTHLQASYFGDQEKRQLSIKTRLYQFRQLLRKIKYYTQLNLQSKDDLIILNGDLNMNSLMMPIKLNAYSPLIDQCSNNQFLEYQAFARIFKEQNIQAIDYCYLSYGQHPITFGDGDQILTGQDQSHSRQSLDYIFELKFKNKKQNQNKIKQHSINSSIKLVPIQKSCKVQQFKIKDRKYNQLSDHYGVSIILEKQTVKKQ